MPWYSSTSWTVMPIGVPPRQMATRNVGLNPLRTIRMASSIESRSSDSAEMKTFSTACDGGGEVTNAPLRRRLRHFDTYRGAKRRAIPSRCERGCASSFFDSAGTRASCQHELALLEQIEVRSRNETRHWNAESSEQVRHRSLARADTIRVSQNHLEFNERAEALDLIQVNPCIAD